MAPTTSPDTTAPFHFSLLVCTVERVAELERLLDSLRHQRYRRFDVVIVDQNEDDRLGPVVRKFSEQLEICRIRSERGLSRARNAGLPQCRGEIIALPDDDCWYPEMLLERVARAFHEQPHAGFVLGRWQDEAGHDALGVWPAAAEAVDDQHIWTRAISFTTFMRRAAMAVVGRFDERLGVGAGTPWGAGEETDYLLRAMSVGVAGWYEPECVVHHPRPPEYSTARAAVRALSYGRGIGFVLRKHCAGGGRIIRFLARPLAGATLSFATLRWGRARFHLLVFTGRCIGLLGG